MQAQNLILLLFCCLSFPLSGQKPALVVPTGHASPIAAVAVSPDGGHVLTGSLDGIAILWDHNGDQLTSFQDLSMWKRKATIFNRWYSDDAPTFGVSAAALLPDGRMITGSKSGKIIIWKSDGSQEKEITEHEKAINTIRLAPDGQYFATGDENGNLVYWDVAGNVIWKEKNAHNKVLSLVFSPDGGRLFSGGANRKIEVWNTDNGENLESFSKVKGLGDIIALDVSPDGQFLLAGNLPGAYNTYDLETEKPDRSAFVLNLEGDVVRELDQHGGSPLAVAFTPHSGLPVVGTSKGEVVLYPRQGSPRVMKVHQGEVTQLVADLTSGTADQIISAGQDGRALRLAPVQQETVREYAGLIGQFAGFGINRKGTMELLWYGKTGAGGIFDLSDRRIKPIEDLNDPITAAKYRGLYQGPGELQEYKLTYNGMGRVERVNQRNDQVEKSDEIREHKKAFLRALSSDGSRAFAAMDYQSDEEMNSLEALNALMDIDAERRKMVCGLLLNYESGQIFELRGHAKMIISAAFSSDNQKLLTGSWDHTAILWDAGANATVLDGHEEGVTAVAFSPDNSVIVTAGEDQRLFIRDGEGRIRHSIENLGIIPSQALFSADNRFLFLTDEKSIVHIFDVGSATKLGRLFLFKGEDWAFVGEDGLFDASPGAMSKMYYTIPANGSWERLELDQLKARFFEPNIIAKQLGLSPERARSADGLTDVPLFPEISASIAADQLSVRLRARSGGIGPVSLFVNGKEVQRDANPGREEAFSLDLKPLQKYLDRGKDAENRLALRAYNQDGWLKSPAFSLTYKPEVWLTSKGSASDEASVPSAPGETGEPRLYIVTIGTSDYTGDQLDLQFADQDAKVMAMALQSVGSQLFSGPEQLEVHCLNTTQTTATELSEKGIRWQFAEKENIKNVFAEIGQTASARDIVLVYLSGHGITYGSAEQAKFHYLTQGISSDDLSDKAIRDKYTISDEELTTWINTIPALKQVLVIDACNSGKVVENLTSGSKSLSSGQILALDRMKDRTGMFVISGSTADKVSYESSEFGQGLLTYSLLQGMNGVAVRKTARGDFIDVMNLFQYARDEVPELAASISGIQTPMLGFPNEGASFDIGIYNQLVEIPLAVQKPVFIQSNFQNEVKFEDDLGLSALLDRKFQDEANKGASADLVFVDLKQRTDAYSVKGRYTLENGVITVNVRLFSPDGSSESLKISPEADADRLSSLIFRAAKKAIRNR